MFDFNRADPVFLGPLRWLPERLRLPLSFLWIIVLALPLGFSAALSGLFWTHRGVRGTAADLGIFLGRPQDFGGSTFALLRDYPTLATLFGASLTIPVMFVTCQHMNEQMRRVVAWDQRRTDGGQLITPPINVYESAATDSFHQLGRMWSLLLLFGVVAIEALHYAFSQSSSFQLLASDNADFVRVAWWAGDSGGFWCELAYCVSGSLLLYAFIRNNALGYAYLRFWLKLDREGWNGLDVLNGDGYFGWEPLRRVLTCAYVSMLLSAVATVSLFLVLDPRGFLLGSPILLLFLFSIPMHGLVPLWLLRRNERRWQTFRIEQTRVQFETATAAMDQRSDSYLRLENDHRKIVEDIRKIRIRLFRPISILAAVLGYAVPIASLFFSSK